MTHTEITITQTATRRVQLPYFAKLGTMYIWVAGKKTDGSPMGHAIYSDGSIVLNTSCVSDAWHVDAIEVTEDDFFARWRDAVTELEALGNYEGGAE